MGGPGDWGGQSSYGRVHVRNVAHAVARLGAAGAGKPYELHGPGSFLFGYSVAAVGDVNGDGFGDLGIGMATAPASVPGHRGRWLLLTGVGQGKLDAIGEFPWDAVGTTPVPWR